MNLVNLLNKFNSQLDFYNLSNENNNNKNNNEIFPWSYDDYLQPFLENPDEIVTISENSSMIFINYLLLSAIKLKITIRIDINKFDLSILPKPIMKLLGVFGNTLATISDLPLHFNEMIYKDIFTDTNKMIYLIMTHLIRQGIRESYKILGCMDMIGNPIGLVNKVGTGFIEFFNEPRKGFAHGPIGIGEGIVKGVGSLVQNIVGGSFEAIGKITGTFLQATKNLQGEKYNLLQQKEPENLIDGVYSGFKGAIKDLGKGITGIFTNPYKSAKKGGVKGFFKGLGTGIVGFALTPFAMAFRLGNNIVVGMKNNLMFNSNLKTRRFRYPRQIDTIALKPYDEDKAMVKAILFYLKDFKNEDIIYFKLFNYFERGFDHENFKSSLILTNKHVLVVYEAKTLAKEIPLNSIKNVEIHRENENVDDSFFIHQNFLLMHFAFNLLYLAIKTSDHKLSPNIIMLLGSTFSSPKRNLYSFPVAFSLL
jgi:vacuolar protein sorting-associated protein 13A/C